MNADQPTTVHDASQPDRPHPASELDSGTPCERVLAFFDGKEFDRAVQALLSYYAPGLHFTGSEFDSIRDTGTPSRYTPADILAVSALSVEVPTRAAMWLINSPDVADLLAAVPDTAALWTEPARLDPAGPAWKLWKMIRAQRQVGRTIASKLLAVKRPLLIPIYDQHIERALSFGANQWAFMQDVAQDPRAPELLTKIWRAKSEADAPDNVGALRIIDVVIWMRAHGWTTHSPEPFTCGCNYSGFSQPLPSAAMPA